MDVDDTIILTLALWAIITSVIVPSIDIYVTLLLIGLLVIAEVAGSFIKPEAKQVLKPAIFFLLFVFLIIVAKKILEVLK
ncbi:MAG: hypothetical protein H0Z28_09590 [Archaeoglobus sp.]|nr:hypothetical protein [Archaeoglobus sp.]